MKIERIFIGGWFQRTMLHLTEIYDFLREGTSRLNLNKKKLLELQNNLNIKNIEYNIDGFEYILITTNDDIEIKVLEDGLILLNKQNKNKDLLHEDIEILKSYYETKLSPAFSYIFSLGAPVPKELANIATVYPYFIVLNNAKRKELDEILNSFDKQKYFEFISDSYDVLRGDKYYFINLKKKTLSQAARYIEEQIFIREFKGQLHRYLNLHRIIWEKIADVKEKAKVKGKDILSFTTKIEGYAKTINLVDSRINQMNTYLKTREKIAKDDDGLNEFKEVMEYRYETLSNTLSYIQQLWSMTKNYVNSANKLFGDLQQTVTKKSVQNLTIVTSMGVGASLIGLFTAKEIPSITIFGVGYFFALALIGWGVNKLLNRLSENRKYEVADIEYDKNIK
jgi:hypothetical protein